MKQLIQLTVLLFCIGISSNSFAQNQIQLSDIEMVNLGDGQTYAHSRDDEKTAINGKTRIITGFTTEYIDAEFAKGYATGKWEYYKNNKLSAYTSYDNGYMDGEYAELFGSGSPKLKGQYTKGKKEGEWQTYNSDGDKKQTEVYKANDLVKRITYYTNGNIDSERNYKNGKEDGAIKQYTLEGTLKAEKNYVNGKQVGKQLQYYYSNMANYIETSNYSLEGKKEGEYTEVYDETKKFKVKGQYSNNQKVGKWIYEDKVGQKTKEEVYENGALKSFIKIEYYSTPEKDYIVETSNYSSDGRKEGEYTEVYTKSKAFRVKGQYSNNQKVGKWIYEDKAAQKIKEEIYENGVLKTSGNNQQ